MLGRAAGAGVVGSSTSSSSSRPWPRGNSGELPTTILSKTRRERERAVTVMSGRGLGRGKGEREGQHGHQLAVAHLGQRRSLETMLGSSSPAAAIPPSWRCARGGGGRERCWSGAGWRNSTSGRHA